MDSLIHQVASCMTNIDTACSAAAIADHHRKLLSNIADAELPTSCAAGQKLPTSGNVFITMTDKHKADIVPVAKDLADLGFGILATEVCSMPLQSRTASVKTGVSSGTRLCSQSWRCAPLTAVEQSVLTDDVWQ